MRRRPGTFASSRPDKGRWLRWLLAAVVILLLLFLLYGCAVQHLVYSSRGTLIFLPASPLG